MKKVSFLSCINKENTTHFFKQKVKSQILLENASLNDHRQETVSKCLRGIVLFSNVHETNSSCRNIHEELPEILTKVPPYWEGPFF